MTRPLQHLSVVTFALLAALVGGCVSDQQVIDQANALHGDIEPAVVKADQDAELARYVQAVGDRIVDAARDMAQRGELDDYDVEPWMFEDVQFHLVASPQLNAFTTGGKHIYLYSKLFEQSDTEAAFAGVVGHEYGHIIGRHVKDSMTNQLVAGLAAAGLVGGAAILSDEGDRERNTALAGTAAGAGTMLGVSYFSRDNEREADALGYEFYVRAGYPPEQFPDFFKELIAESGGAGQGGVEGFFSTHPQLADRVAAAERRAEQTSPEVVRQFAKPPIAEGRTYARLQGESQPLTVAAARQEQSQTKTALTRALAILEAFPSCLASEEMTEE